MSSTFPEPSRSTDPAPAAPAIDHPGPTTDQPAGSLAAPADQTHVYETPWPDEVGGQASGATLVVDEPARTTDVAKDRAADVKDNAAGAAKDVAAHAQGQASDVASHATDEAKGLLGKAKGEATSQAASTISALTDSLRSLGQELSAMASHDQTHGTATGLVQQGADQTNSLADWLEGKEPGQVLDGVTRYARQNPGTFIALAAGAGVLAGRLARGLRDDSADA